MLYAGFIACGQGVRGDCATGMQQYLRTVSDSLAAGALLKRCLRAVVAVDGAFGFPCKAVGTRLGEVGVIRDHDKWSGDGQDFGACRKGSFGE